MNRRKFLQAVGLVVAAFVGRSSIAVAQRTPALSPTVLKKARSIGKDLVESKELSFSALDDFILKTPEVDVMKTLFAVFKESINQINEDKKYFLDMLKKHNEIAQALGDYLRDLNSTGNKNDQCTPSTAIKTTVRLERAVDKIEEQAKKLPIKERSQPQIKSLLHSIERDRKLLKKARTIYKGL